MEFPKMVYLGGSSKGIKVHSAEEEARVRSESASEPEELSEQGVASEETVVEETVEEAPTSKKGGKKGGKK